MKLDLDFRKRHQGYSGARPDVVRMVEGAPRKMLDVGCGGGMTASLVRDVSPGAKIIGLEPDPELASHAIQRMDRVVVGSAEDPAILLQLESEAPFDLIVCADVLEHMADPWTVLARLAGWLAPDGQLVTSIPNVRHISTFLSLGLAGRWPRRNRGIHDGTHLRFFARADILDLGKAAGLEPERERRNLRLVESLPWTMVPARMFDFWPLRGFLTFQYLHRWRRREP